MPTNRGGKKREKTNLKRRQEQYDLLSADKQRARKRPGSNKK